MKGSLIQLNGTSTQIILESVPNAAPLWRYWGPHRVPAAADLRTGEPGPRPSFSPDTEQRLTIFPTFGHGWFRQSALLAHRAGRHFEQRIDGCEVHWIEPARAVRLELLDRVAGIRVRLSLAFDSSDVLLLSSDIVNEGDDVLDLQWLAAAVLPLPPEIFAVRSFTGRHLDEFRLQTDVLSRTLWRRENRRGLTSHDCFPGAVAIGATTDTDFGIAYGAHLGWSGNHVQTIEIIDDARYQWLMGEWLAPGEIRLAPGEVYVSPPAFAACSSSGLNGLAHMFHGSLRARLRWPGSRMQPRPVCINTWEAMYFDQDLRRLRALADRAAALGVERFVLDDGWFHRRQDDAAGLGDWRCDAAKYPQGLGAIVQHVTKLGMQFGLWLEPEMVNPDSDLFRAHPDWALQAAGRPLLTARNQLVLDLSRPEVSEYLFGTIDALLREHSITCLKWDHNRDLAPAAGADGRARYHAQVEAAYALMARVRAAHSDVEIESCAGGGGRVDFGVLQHAHRVWTSDNIDACSRVRIQRGFLQFFPPEIMGAHIGTSPAHTTGRSQPLAFRAGVALPGHLGLELDLCALDAEALRALAAWIALYKELRPSLHGGPVWLGDAPDEILWQAHANRDLTELVVFVYRVEPATLPHPPRLQLQMLNPSTFYCIERIDPAAVKDSFQTVDALSGAELAAIGLQLPPMRAEECLVLHMCIERRAQ